MIAFIKGHLSWLIVIVLILIVSGIGYEVGQRSRDSEVADLSTRLVQSEKTVEVGSGLYATALVQVGNLQNLLTESDASVQALKKQLSDSQAQLLTTQQIVVQWKSAYQGATRATQTVVVQQGSGGGSAVVAQGSGGSDSTSLLAERVRVDFSQDFGPIDVVGYTLTNPAYGYVSVSQKQPLELTVSVAKNKDGTWQSYVTSADPTVSVNVKLGGVDPGVLAPSWYQRIWLTAGMEVLGDVRASLGASYHFDRWALGASCSIGQESHGCGITVGFRPFQ